LPPVLDAAIAKHGKGQATDDLAEAVRMLLEQNLIANLPPTAQQDTNQFRIDRWGVGTALLYSSQQ
jgi:hypothetical protein